ncbi:unnamed protein product [Heterobilharzia americana]|nr:unnamed protein product [Heterobilharzia americana]
MGGEAFSADHLQRLKETLKQLGEDYRLSNSKKNIFHTFRTPAVLAVTLLLFYIVTEYLNYWIINDFCYTGRSPELANAIDQSADLVMNKIFTPAIEVVGRRGLAQIIGGGDLVPNQHNARS